MRLLIFALAFFTLQIVFPSSTARTAVLPQFYGLNTIEEKKVPGWDPELKGFIERFVQKSSVLDLNSQEREERIKADPMVHLFVDLYRANKAKKSSSIKKIDERIASLSEYQMVNHPMTDYVFEQLIRYYEKDEKKQEKYQEQFLGQLGPSCSSQRVVKKYLSQSSHFVSNSRNIDAVLSFVEKQSTKFKEEAMEKVLANVPNRILRPYQKKLNEIAKGLPQLQVKYSLLDIKNMSIEENAKIKISHEIKKKRCYRAHRVVNQTFKDLSQKQDHIDFLMEIVDRVGNCYRRHSRKSLTSFWVQKQPTFKKHFGSRGEALAKIRLGRLYWNNDKYDKAKHLVRQAMAIGSLLQDRFVESKALYLLGRINENEQNFTDGLMHYVEYIKKFPDQPEIIKVLRSLVLIHSRKQDWASVRFAARRLLEAEQDKPFLSQDTSFIGFGLFWLGRSYYEQGQLEKAFINWKRLASEHFSTYYGALGHQFIEKLKNTKYSVVQPRTARFNASALSALFVHEKPGKHDQVRWLLELGLKKDAACEIKNIKVNAQSPKASFAKSLYLHVSGEWLDAIVEFARIPRHVRRNLPLGAERIIFPKNYENIVDHYAEKIGSDPDFIYSVIRQESVFNPEARSPAGARGLMQLMRRTAYSEAKRLRRDYVSPKEKRNLIRSSRQSRKLYDERTNIALGVHYLHGLVNRYGHPALSLAAYNAGPSVLRRWLKKYPTEDILYFIERIPYKETRNYVKLIMRNYFYYKRWYRPPQDKLPYIVTLPKSIIPIEDQKS